MILCVIFVVLMMFWLFGGGYVVYSAPPAANTNVIVLFGTHTLIPWACVAILGWIVFGGHPVVVR